MAWQPTTSQIPPASARNRTRAAPGANQPVKFSGDDRFIRELRRRVDEYFQLPGRAQRDCPLMYLKTAVVLTIFFAAYLLLLFVAGSAWMVIGLAVLLGLAVAAVGFNIAHDGGHRAYSRRPWVNRIMALTLELIGGSSYVWNWKHNLIHHTYPNIEGEDDDINLGPLARLSPAQRRLWFHRFQGVYLWLLYGLLAIKWHFFDDFYNVAAGRINGRRIPRPRGADLAVFIAGKVVFFSLALVIPMLLHPVWVVLGVYSLVALVSGVVLSIVFQLAHCVGEADFPSPVESAQGGRRMANDWAVHQVQSTVDFARNNRVACWLLGGLNFQIEHHLFHRICHVHYPALSQVVEQTCREFGVRYTAQRSLRTALASHARWIWVMGQR